MKFLSVLALVIVTQASAQERSTPDPDKCWDKRIQLWVTCDHLKNINPLLPGKECWHHTYQSFDTCDSESFKDGYKHAQTPREACHAIGKELDITTGLCHDRDPP